MNLQAMFKKLVELEAGHRSVIAHGIYAVGGGSTDREPGKSPSDDLGKMNAIYDQIINNKLFLSVTENSSAEEKRIFKVTLGEIVTVMTDILLQRGKELNIAGPVMEKLNVDRELKGEFLDAYVEKLNVTLKLDPVKEFTNAFDKAYAKVLKGQGVVDQLKSYMRMPSQKEKLLADLNAKLKSELKVVFSCNGAFTK